MLATLGDSTLLDGLTDPRGERLLSAPAMPASVTVLPMIRIFLRWMCLTSVASRSLACAFYLLNSWTTIAFR